MLPSYMRYALYGLKICRVCEEEKDVSNFGVDNRTRDGYQGVCLNCASERRKALRRSKISLDREYFLYQEALNWSRAREVSFCIFESHVKIPDICPYTHLALDRGATIKLSKPEHIPILICTDIKKGFVPSGIEVISLKAKQLTEGYTQEQRVLIKEELAKRRAERDESTAAPLLGISRFDDRNA